MAKISLSSNFTGSTEPDLHFLVQDQADAKALNALGFSSHVLHMDGTPLTDWTKGKNVAENELAGMVNNKSHLVLLLPRFAHENAKIKNMAMAFGEFSRNIGIQFHNPPIERGALVSEVIEHFADTIFSMASMNGHLTITPESSEDAEGPTGNDDDDPATVLFRLIAANFTLARTADREQLFVLPNDKALLGLRAYEVGSSELRHWMTRTYFTSTGKVVPNGAVASVVSTIEGMCAASNYVYKLASRTFQTVSGDIWIDLGTDNNNAVLIKDGAWSIQTSLPYATGTAFLRDGSVLPIQNPAVVSFQDARGKLEKHLLPYANVAPADWPLMVAWMINHMFPNHNSPIMMLLGGSGAGKSTATAAVKYAVEGGLVLGKVGKFKDSEDDVMVAMSKARVTMYDNVSKVSAELSDTLCQVVHGTTHEKRKLRTDSDVVTLKIDSSLILNGIETGHLRGDLKSRMVPINLNSVLVAQSSEQALNDNIVAAHPEIYGALLTLVAKIAPKLSEAPPFPSSGPEGMRMQSYARVLWALDKLWETKGLDHYIKSLNTLSEDLLDDPLLLTIASLVRQHGTYIEEHEAYEGVIGTKEMLHRYQPSTMSERVQEHYGNREPIKPQKLGGMLTRAENEWSRLGVKFSKEARATIRGEQQITYWFRITNQELMDQAKKVVSTL
ncbi:hypothetical protein [Paeniglutamicibacter sp. Y32M11]|uniref:hypothetical protein n=1 Tax=Paeniglutamicibacter sp. Y32M11 TaxID=2853258 RepID=UPI001C52775A|nr:hypothetical protein [Paeniglutamicibacter sp. Y32M11]QXQ11489.1 hypothetical protein KUF55_06285 [Paeniglutamicibacter sp. Y32M11]